MGLFVWAELNMLFLIFSESPSKVNLKGMYIFSSYVIHRLCDYAVNLGWFHSFYVCGREYLQKHDFQIFFDNMIFFISSDIIGTTEPGRDCEFDTNNQPQ